MPCPRIRHIPLTKRCTSPSSSCVRFHRPRQERPERNAAPPRRAHCLLSAYDHALLVPHRRREATCPHEVDEHRPIVKHLVFELAPDPRALIIRLLPPLLEADGTTARPRHLSRLCFMQSVDHGLDTRCQHQLCHGSRRPCLRRHRRRRELWNLSSARSATAPTCASPPPPHAPTSVTAHPLMTATHTPRFDCRKHPLAQPKTVVDVPYTARSSCLTYNCPATALSACPLFLTQSIGANQNRCDTCGATPIAHTIKSPLNDTTTVGWPNGCSLQAIQAPERRVTHSTRCSL